MTTETLNLYRFNAFAEDDHNGSVAFSDYVAAFSPENARQLVLPFLQESGVRNASFEVIIQQVVMPTAEGKLVRTGEKHFFSIHPDEYD